MSNCSRCDSPLAGTVHETQDGEVCHSCFNSEPDKDLGEVVDYRFIPQSETPEEVSFAHCMLQTEEGEEVRMSCKGEDHAEEIFESFAGSTVTDKGDVWVLEPEEEDDD